MHNLDPLIAIELALILVVLMAVLMAFGGVQRRLERLEQEQDTPHARLTHDH